MAQDFAYHSPAQPLAYSPTNDAAMEREPPNMDAVTGDVVSDMRRLGGARALPNLKERGT